MSAADWFYAYVGGALLFTLVAVAVAHDEPKDVAALTVFWPLVIAVWLPIAAIRAVLFVLRGAK